MRRATEDVVASPKCGRRAIRQLESAVATSLDDAAQQLQALALKDGFVGKIRRMVCSRRDSECVDGEPRDELNRDDSYLIQRSDGGYSEGWIYEYDESCGLYHVLIVGVGYTYVAREHIELNTVHL